MTAMKGREQSKRRQERGKIPKYQNQTKSK
jgi:hypothetical protein